jgi:predicted HicB family RNase H-like nuclease
MELRKWQSRTGRDESQTRIVSVRLPVDLHEAAKQLAKSEGSSVTALVEQSLSKALRSANKKGLVPN